MDQVNGAGFGFGGGFPGAAGFPSVGGLGALTMPVQAANFNFGAFSGFPGGGGAPRPKTKPDEKEVLMGVNRCINQLYHSERNKRNEKARKKSQQTPREKSGKSAPVTDFVEKHLFQRDIGNTGNMSALEDLLHRRSCSVDVSFDPEIKKHVEKEFPSFYGMYKTADDVTAALIKFEEVWTWKSS